MSVHRLPVRPAFRCRISPEQRLFQTYELAKRRFDAFFPDATAAERERAFAELARQFGIV